jgi:hypothetical protein
MIFKSDSLLNFAALEFGINVKKISKCFFAFCQETANFFKTLRHIHPPQEGQKCRRLKIIAIFVMKSLTNTDNYL